MYISEEEYRYALEQQWHFFNGDYVKDFYEVEVDDETIIHQCWPNAGELHAPNGQVFTVEDEVRCRIDSEYAIGIFNV